jgi:hypothetical protein
MTGLFERVPGSLRLVPDGAAGMHTAMHFMQVLIGRSDPYAFESLDSDLHVRVPIR